MNIFYTMDSRLRGNDSNGLGNNSGGTMVMTAVIRRNDCQRKEIIANYMYKDMRPSHGPVGLLL